VPVNVALVIDRSGSMGGQKIRLARDAATQAIRMLRQEDRFSVVVYDDIADVLVASTQATAEAREEAIRRIEGVESRGSTDLGSGWLKGCEQVAEHLRP
jgi:Ca-activated chloride channel family protein